MQEWAAALSIHRRPIRVRLDLPALPERERANWQQRIERSHNDCGCSAAAIAFLGAICLILGYWVSVGFEQPIWLIAMATVLAAIVALFAGKTLGHLWSRKRLRHQVSHVIQLVEQRTANESYS